MPASGLVHFSHLVNQRLASLGDFGLMLSLLAGVQPGFGIPVVAEAAVVADCRGPVTGFFGFPGLLVVLLDLGRFSAGAKGATSLRG